MPPVPGQGVGTALLHPCPHGLTPGCDGASALASARGGSRETGREAELRQERVLSPQQWRGGGTWGVLVRGARGVRGPAAPAHIPAMLLLPESATAAEIRKDFGDMERRERLHRKLGAGWEWLPFMLMDTIPPNLPVTPLRPRQSPGLSATETQHSTSRETSRSREAKGHRHTQGEAALQAAGIERTGFVPLEVCPNQLFFSSVVAVSFIPTRKLLKLLQFSSPTLLAASAPLKGTSEQHNAWGAETETNRARKWSSPT